MNRQERTLQDKKGHCGTIYLPPLKHALIFNGSRRAHPEIQDTFHFVISGESSVFSNHFSFERINRAQ
jgi:hypothetical protein